MFETKKIYRAIDGSEIKKIMSQRILEAMSQDNTLNIARAFPLLKYQISVKLTPYHTAGAGEPKSDPDICYEVDGLTYCPVLDQAVELVETSPLYGRDADPQELRKLAEQGTVETMRTNTGELVDVRTKPGQRVPAVEPPPSVITEPQSWPDPQAPGSAAVITESPEETFKEEEKRWKTIRDKETDAAVGLALQQIATGTVEPPANERVSIIKSAAEGGGAVHGKRKR